MGNKLSIAEKRTIERLKRTGTKNLRIYSKELVLEAMKIYLNLRIQK